MAQPIAGQSGRSKADSVADAINRLLQTLALRCARADGIRDFFHVGLISYGGSAAVSAFSGGLSGKELVTMSQLAETPLRLEERIKKVDDGVGGILEQRIRMPVWCEAKSGGKTPMSAALRMAHRILCDFIATFPESFPPIVMNLTDGEATDGDPEEAALQLRSLCTVDGGVLLFNLHVSENHARPIEYPATESILPDEFAKRLFRMSNILPENVASAARSAGFDIQPGSRGFVFQADVVSVVQFLDLGTRVQLGGR